MGSATFLSRSDTASLRNRGRRVVDVDGGVQSTVFMRLKSLNRSRPCNWSTTSYVPAGMPSLSAQLGPGVEVHRRRSTPPKGGGGLIRERPRGDIYSQNGWHHVKGRHLVTLGRPHHFGRRAGRYRTRERPLVCIYNIVPQKAYHPSSQTLVSK